MDKQLKNKTIYDAAMDWETSRIYTIEKSERRAWVITLSAVGLTILSWLAIVLMLPLKQTMPFVIRVDKATGVTDIVTALHDKKVNYDDVVDKYWVTNYVRARETYDWYTLQKDYNTVGLLSSPHIGAQYAKLFEGDDALDKKFGTHFRVTVDVISVVPNGKGVATVRFIKHTKRVDQEGMGEAQHWVATVSYEYRDPSLMKESLRLVNPLGFQVLSYRVDPELVEGAK
jgi:type IV secretory pathway component VirB8